MEFDAKIQVQEICDFIKNYYSENRLGGAVVGISGGKDSAVVLALFVKALGKENVVGVTLPCHSLKYDKMLAQKLAKHYGVDLFNLDLSAAFDAFTQAFTDGFDKAIDENLMNSNINLKPRLRMSSLYYYSAMLISLRKKPYLVAGTSNKCELYVGYFTKGGDGVCDISVLADFTVSEVIKLGEELGVPTEILYRPPSDGLSGQTDEEKLGVTYSQIEKVINGEFVEEDVKQRIDKLHANSLHKFNIPTYRR